MDAGKKQAYQEKAEAELREWNAKVEELLAKAHKAKAEGKIQYYEFAEDLQAKRDRARRRLNELKESGAGAWDDVKGGLEQARSELRDALQGAMERFRDRDNTSGARPS